MIDIRKKRILGRLFKKYREKYNKSIIEIEHANISAIKTLYCSFNGEIIKNDDFYINYCNFFNHEYKEDSSLDSWLNNYIVRIIHAFDYYEEDSFNILYEEFANKISDLKEYAIYHEYYLIIQLLFNYYGKNQYLRLEEVEDYLELIDIELFPKELRLYFLDYMFRSNNNYIGNKELPGIIVEKMIKIDKCHYLTKYVQAFICKYNSNFLDSLKYLEDCKLEAKDKNNVYRETQCLLALYGTYRNIDQSLANKVSEDLLKIKEKSIPNNLKLSINYSVGMQDYLEGRYLRAYELFNEILINQNSNMSLLFQCSICSRLDKKFPKELFSNEIENRYDFIYLNYFRMKQNQVDNVKLAKYILNEIIPKKLKDEIYRNPYWSLFEYEMHDMADNDIKLRKYYVNFMKEEKKYCKDA